MGGFRFDLFLCLLRDGRIATWGDGRKGRLGQGRPEHMFKPTVIPNVDGARSCTAGMAHALCVLVNGSVISWGDANDGRSGHGVCSGACEHHSPIVSPLLSNVHKCSASKDYTVCVLTNGSAVSFGLGLNGQLGHGNLNSQPTPKIIKGLESLGGVRHCATASSFNAIYEKNHHRRNLHLGGHTICVMLDGTVYTFGWNEDGQLGQADTEDKLVPTKVPGLDQVLSCSAGYAHSICVHEDGSVLSSGYGGSGQLGHGDLNDQHSPKTIVNLGGVLQCTAGAVHTVCIRSDSTVVAFGSKSGQGSEGAHPLVISEGPVTAPVVVQQLEGVVQCGCLSSNLTFLHSTLCALLGLGTMAHFASLPRKLFSSNRLALFQSLWWLTPVHRTILQD